MRCQEKFLQIELSRHLNVDKSTIVGHLRKAEREAYWRAFIAG